VGDANGTGVLERAQEYEGSSSDGLLDEVEVIEAEVMSDDEVASSEHLSPKKVRAALTRLGRPLTQKFVPKSKDVNGMDESKYTNEPEAIKHKRGWTKKIAKIATQSPKKSLAALKGRSNVRKMERLDSQDEIRDWGSLHKSLHVDVSTKEDGMVESPVSSSATVEVDDIVAYDLEGITLHMPDREVRSFSDNGTRDTVDDRIDACGSYANGEEESGFFMDQPSGHLTCDGTVWVRSKSGCVQHLELDIRACSH
jgi:hypothetical protein